MFHRKRLPAGGKGIEVREEPCACIDIVNPGLKRSLSAVSGARIYSEHFIFVV